MKQLLTLLSVLILLIGCKGDKPEPQKPETSLEVSPSSLSFVTKGETKSFNIIATGDWVTSSSAEWCTLSKAYGNGNATIEVLTVANDESKTRNAKITIKQGQYSVEIAIAQLGAAPDILVDESVRKVNNSAGELTIDVTTNVEYDIAIGDKWIELKQSKAMVKYTHQFAYQENPLTEIRTTTITFKQKGGDLERRVTVEQMNPQIKVYTLETFQKQTQYGTYISEKFTFAFDEYAHQLSVNSGRKSQRIQTFNQDTIASVVLSSVPTAQNEEISVGFENILKQKSNQGTYKTKVVKLEGGKSWLWSDTDKAGFIIKQQ